MQHGDFLQNKIVLFLVKKFIKYFLKNLNSIPKTVMSLYKFANSLPELHKNAEFFPG